MTRGEGQSTVTIEQREGVAVLTLDRDEARNAVSAEMRESLLSALDTLAFDDAVRAVVLTGAGKAFSAGGDITAMRARMARSPDAVAADGWLHQRRETHRLVTRLASLEKPVVAAVNGAAAGLGADMALACDAIVAARGARFIYSYVLRGLIPDGGGMYFLPRRVGLARAKELVFTGRPIEADEALAIGLVDEVVDRAALIDRAVERARLYAAGPGTAIGLAKSIMSNSFEMSLEEVLQAGAVAQGICYASAEHRAAVEAFLAKAG